MNRKERPTTFMSSNMYDEASMIFNRLNQNTISRRDFILRTGLLVIAGVSSSLPANEARAVSAYTSPVYKKDPWLIINIVQQHLFPAELTSPGANEINATAYLKNLLTENYLDDEEKNFILNGPKWLNELAVNQYKKPFARLNTDEQNALLRQIVKSTAGENWLANLLSYIFEALLAAPVYGGNPQGVGWKWLHHQPGFPLPDKLSLTWQQLQKR